MAVRVGSSSEKLEKFEEYLEIIENNWINSSEITKIQTYWKKIKQNRAESIKKQEKFRKSVKKKWKLLERIEKNSENFDESRQNLEKWENSKNRAKSERTPEISPNEVKKISTNLWKK